MEMLACNSDVNDIKELKQQIILIENKLEELRVFYITNKDKYDYDYKLAKTFLDKLQNFIEKEIINVDMYYIQGASGEHFELFNNYIISNYSNRFYSNTINNYMAYSEIYNSEQDRIINPEVYK